MVLDEKAQPLAAVQHGALTQLKDFTRQRRIVCLLDGRDVFLEHVRLPASRNRRKLLQAIPFALEDDLADDLENLHFALGKEQSVAALNGEKSDALTDKQISVPVAVVARENLKHCLTTLAEAGIKPHVLLPDLLALPQSEDQWQILVDRDKATVCTGQQSGFSCDLNNLGTMLDSALEHREHIPAQIQIWNHSQTELKLALADQTPELLISNSDQPPLTTLARGFQQALQINLLQGEFSFKEEYGRIVKSWLLPAALLGGWFMLLIALKLTTYVQLQEKSDDLQEQIIETYKQVFPNSKNFTEPRRQLQNKLSGMGASEDSPLLQLLNAAATQINAIPTATLQALDFNGEYLDLELIVTEVQQLESMRQQLQRQGVNAEIRSADTEGDRVTGEMRLRL